MHGVYMPPVVTFHVPENELCLAVCGVYPMPVLFSVSDQYSVGVRFPFLLDIPKM